MKFLIKKITCVALVFALVMLPALAMTAETNVDSTGVQTSKITIIAEKNQTNTVGSDVHTKLANKSDVNGQNAHKKKHPSGSFLAFLLIIIIVVSSAPILFVIWRSSRRK